MTRFGTLNPDGSVTGERDIPQAALRACPWALLDPEHYRGPEDGYRCRCDDPAEQARLVREYGYRPEDFPTPEATT